MMHLLASTDAQSQCALDWAGRPSFSAYTARTPSVSRQTMVFPHAVRSMKVTQTRYGVTLRNILMGLGSDQVRHVSTPPLNSRALLRPDSRTKALPLLRFCCYLWPKIEGATCTPAGLLTAWVRPWLWPGVLAGQALR